MFPKLKKSKITMMNIFPNQKYMLSEYTLNILSWDNYELDEAKKFINYPIKKNLNDINKINDLSLLNSYGIKNLSEIESLNDSDLIINLYLETLIRDHIIYEQRDQIFNLSYKIEKNKPIYKTKQNHSYSNDSDSECPDDSDSECLDDSYSECPDDSDSECLDDSDSDCSDNSID